MQGDHAASVWRPPGAARALVCWRDAQLCTLSQALDRALADWVAQWGLQALAPVSSSPLERLDTSLPWQRLQVPGLAASWLQSTPDTAERLGALLFAASRAVGPVAASVAVRCERDALARVLAALDLPGATLSSGRPEASELRPWTGGIGVQLPPPLGWRVLLGADAMDAWCRRHGAIGSPAPSSSAQPLIGAVDAAAALAVTLGVELAGCELDLGTLQGLQPGDVVRVQHRIDAPATVLGADGLPLFRAYLGRRAGYRAVELAPLDPIPAAAVGVEENA